MAAMRSPCAPCAPFLLLSCSDSCSASVNPWREHLQLNERSILALLIATCFTEGPKPAPADAGPAELISASLEAVRQWEYKPATLNGKPCYVETRIDVNFTLSAF